MSRLGNQRWIAANSTRPAVTAQNTVSASDAVVAGGPRPVTTGREG
ncbi:MAG TPA: hypothetical protein VE343_17260 [Streptosporangiaceae bacterium]|nr:hypothetical protein [Streptosporangiaceae bacterium]